MRVFPGATPAPPGVPPPIFVAHGPVPRQQRNPRFALSFQETRQKFSTEEDDALRGLVARLGDNNWTQVSLELGTRSARQCRERFRNYLSPNLKTEPWTDAEDQLLVDKVTTLGPKWAIIVGSFPTRSKVSLKNRWAQLSTRPFYVCELDIEQARHEVIRALDGVIARAAGREAHPEHQPRQFSFAPIEWSDDGLGAF
jgi:hypothetical protein